MEERKLTEATLGEREAHYRSLFEDSPISLWEKDFSRVKTHIDSLKDSGIGDLKIYLDDHPEEVFHCTAIIQTMDMNRATLELFEAESQDLFMNNLTLISFEEAYDALRDSIIAIAEGRTSFECETLNRTLSGKKIDIFLRWSVARGCERTYSRVFLSIIDITERKQAERELLRYVQHMELLQDIDRAVLNEKSSREIVDTALERMLQLIPYTRASITLFDFAAWKALVFSCKTKENAKLKVGDRVSLDLYGIHLLHRGKIHMVEAVETLTQKSIWHQYLLAEGVHSYINVPLIVRGELLGSLNLGAESSSVFSNELNGFAHSVAASLAIAIQQSRLFRSITEQNNCLRSLGVRLTRAEEDERRRLARELHDQVGQNLTALGINLNIIAGQLSPDSAAKIEDRLEDSLRLVEEIARQIRDVMAELRPEVLEDYGLFAALRSYGERFSNRTGLKLSVKGEDMSQRLSVLEEATLFRIAQEALTNIAKHARANRVTLTLKETGEAVRLTIDDDGKGFDAKILQHSSESGWGLLTMQERALAIGGQVNMASQPGKGTRVEVILKRGYVH